MKKYDIYGIGAALVDTEVEVSDEFLSKASIDKGVMTLVDEARQVKLLGALSAETGSMLRKCGGSVCNSVVAASSLGAQAFFSGKVADDADGDIYLADLEASGVAHSLSNRRGSGTTGKCLVLITPDAERSMNTYLGVSETLSVAEVDDQAIAASDWVYLEGYLVTSPTGHEAALHTRQVAEANNVKTAISFSDPGMVMYFRDNMEQLVGDGVDLVFCNEAEALEWGKTDNLEAALEAIKQVAKSFVVTLGAKGAIAFDGSASYQVDAHTVEALNTNGAGDMFAGAFLYALSRGEGFQRAGEFAVRAAGEVVKYFGPRLQAEGYPALRHEFFGD